MRLWNSQFMILHLVRTTFNLQTCLPRKDQSHIRFPLEHLDMTPFVYTPNPDVPAETAIYDLLVVVVHHGKGCVNADGIDCGLIMDCQSSNVVVIAAV